MAAAGGADVTNADADAVVFEVGDDGLKGRGGLLDRRLEAVPWGRVDHGRDARGRRPRAPESQGWQLVSRGQERR